MVINWPNFKKSVQSQGIERERWENVSWWSNQNTEHLSVKFSVLDGGSQ